MENRFGTSFKDVRVHTDAAAGRQAIQKGARAFTAGNDVYFAPGHFQPASRIGLGLVAHELAHVVQQRNGRFSAAMSPSQLAPARSRLEDEAEAIERSVVSSSSPLQVSQAAPEPRIHRSPGALDALRAGVTGSIDSVADWVLSQLDDASDAIFGNLSDIRSRLRNLTEIQLTPETAARFQEIFDDFKSLAPNWLPVPSISFAGAPTQEAAQLLAIPIGVILLFIAFLIVLWWLITNLDPTIRRSRERAVEEVIRKLGEALFRGPIPKAQPVPAPPQTVPPEVVPDNREPKPKTGPEPGPGPKLGPDNPPFPPFGPDRPQDPRRTCLETHPSALVCSGFSDLEETVINFLIAQDVNWEDLGNCSGDTSFGPGSIDACDGAPGETWHCDVKGSNDVVSVFGCLCCHEDGSTGFEWRRPHFSSGSRSGRRNVKR